MSKYCYSPLSPSTNNIRLLRLLRPAKESTQRTRIQCELFEYSLQDPGKGTHLYEALSYTWGGEEKPCSITIEKHNLDITANLHAALLHLRNRSLDRIIWIDAICIDQDNTTERAEQVQLMAIIYSKAHRVLVWLGEEDDTEGALEDIQLAANEEPTERSNREVNEKAISNLLQRQWFQRIWVLQEVAAARHVVIMCGSTEIDGYAFCSGLKSLQKLQKLSYSKLQSLSSLTNLIIQAGLRPKHSTDSIETYSLEISSLAELVDMFHTRQATDARDKVYALLGMSSDNHHKVGLRPNYEIPWENLLCQFVKFVLSENLSVEPFGQSRQKAVIKSKGCILGQVSSVRGDNKQNVTIKCRNAPWGLGWEIGWTLRASAKHIQEHDIICLISGASKPSIIRLCKDHFSVVVIAATPLNGGGNFGWLDTSRSTTNFLRDFLLVWDWEQP
ncbi:heterokaryon incompatibility protein-domain-containing protein, partial [Tricladium varicosporioides]